MDVARSAPPCLRIAVLNDGHDTISALSEWFQMHGHMPLAIRVTDLRKGPVQPADVVDALRPDVLLFDVGIPYAVNWYFAEILKLALPELPIILTTASLSTLDEIVGTSRAFQLTGTPANLTTLLGIVYKASGRGPDGHKTPSA